MATTLGGCATSSDKPRALPSAPSYLTPAVVAEPQQGEACLLVAARERAGRKKNEKIIGFTRADWNAMVATYSGKQR